MHPGFDVIVPMTYEPLLLLLLLLWLLCADEAEDPACMPIFWVSKWVDYSDKYGLGYQLCDNSVGVLFNDCSRLLLGSDGE